MSPVVVFDLDGTLLNTLEDITSVVNMVFSRRGIPSKTSHQVKAAVGSGVEELARRLLPGLEGGSHRIDKIADDIRKTYSKHSSRSTRPYEGIPALLRNLQELRIPMAVLTNKPHDSAVKAITGFFPNVGFRVVQGVKPGGPMKPSLEAVKPVLWELGASPSNALMVGDSDVDMRTASMAGMYAIGVEWGFRDARTLRVHGASTVIQHPSQLLPIVRERL